MKIVLLWRMSKCWSNCYSPGFWLDGGNLPGQKASRSELQPSLCSSRLIGFGKESLNININRLQKYSCVSFSRYCKNIYISLCLCFTGKYASAFGGGGSQYAYYHEEDESSFQLVDTQKVQKPVYTRGRRMFQQVWWYRRLCPEPNLTLWSLIQALTAQSVAKLYNIILKHWVQVARKSKSSAKNKDFIHAHYLKDD